MFEADPFIASPAEVGWEEFEAAAKRLNFQGDLPGAWRFFDQELDTYGFTMFHVCPPEARLISIIAKS